MGIKRLNTFLTNELKLIKIYDTIDEYLNINGKEVMYVAVDAYLQLHKFLVSDKNYLIACLYHTIKLLRNNIIPIYIFDGIPSSEKNNTIKNRIDRRYKLIDKIDELESRLNEIEDDNEKLEIYSEIKNKKKQIIKINKSHILQMKNLLDILNIQYFNANGEADVLCAELVKSKKVDACLSDDMDLLLFGCNKLIKIIKTKIYEYDINHILNNINLTFEQFIDMCLLFGCDYVKSNIKISPKEIYELINKYKNIENIISNIDNDKILDNYHNYIKARHIFKESYIFEDISNIIINKKSNNDLKIFKLNTFLQFYNDNKIILNDSCNDILLHLQNTIGYNEKLFDINIIIKCF